MTRGMTRGRTKHTVAHRCDGAGSGAVADQLVVEEPLEIHLDEELVATTMRTPGHDFELAAGFLWAEGRLGAAPAELQYGPPTSAASTEFNSVNVVAARGRGATTRPSKPPAARLGLTSSSCGICGARQIDALTQALVPFVDSDDVGADLAWPSSDANVGPGAAQDLFGLTGGSHAAAALDASGRPMVVREDIGRHNAVDKVVGRMLLDGTLGAPGATAGDPSPSGQGSPAATDHRTLWVSGRVSFEIVQKAWAGGFCTVVAVGAVSALALHTARRANMTLVGFAREGRGTFYTGARRWGLP